MATIKRIIPPTINEDGSISYQSVMSPPDDSIAVCYMVPMRVIPVIFVPGVMGSNLEEIEKGKIVWDVSDPSALMPWIGRGPETRKEILDPGKVRASAQGKLPAGTALKDEESVAADGRRSRRCTTAISSCGSKTY